MSGHLPLEEHKHTTTREMLQAFETNCPPTRLPIHLHILKRHLSPLPDMRCLGGESPWGPGNTPKSCGCLLRVGSAQQSISLNAEPARLEPCSPRPLEAELHLGTLAPSCGHLLEQPLSGFPPLAQHCSGLHCLGSTCGLGLLARFQEKPRSALPRGLSLSQRLRAPRPT